MKRDVAERLAATAVEELTVEDARHVIDKFLTEIARCPVCDGSGTHTFSRDVFIKEQTDEIGRPVENPRIRAGTIASCPWCGGENPAVSGKGDPAYVGWHCVQGTKDQDCLNARDGDEASRDRHADCGWRVMLPLNSTNGETP